jgi:hypothetical protein
MIRIERLHFKGMAIYPSLYGVDSLEKGGRRTSSIPPCYLGHFSIVGRGWQYPSFVLLCLIGVERIPYLDSNLALTLRDEFSL